MQPNTTGGVRRWQQPTNIVAMTTNTGTIHRRRREQLQGIDVTTKPAASTA